MGHGDYTLQEFAVRLADIEARFAKELQAVIECFVQSRTDLPAKHLEDISRGHSKRAKQLKKAVDHRKTDGLNLWKITNVYSATCVDVDDGMREVRASLRKHIKKESMKIRMNGEDVHTYRRVADDYRPLITQRVQIKLPETPPKSDSPPLEIYDTNAAPTTIEEKQRWLEIWRAQVEREDKEREETRRKIEKRQSMKLFGSSVNLGGLANINLGNLNLGRFFSDRKPVFGNGLGGIGSPNLEPRHHSATLRAEAREREQEFLTPPPSVEPPPVPTSRIPDSPISRTPASVSATSSSAESLVMKF